MEFVTSEKLKPLIVVEGYKFNFHKTLKDGIQRWKCTTNSCKSFFKLDDTNKMIGNVSDHNHNKLDDKVFNRQTISNRLKRKAVDDISAKPSKLIREELRKGDVDSLTADDMTCIRHNIHPRMKYAVFKSDV